MEDVPEIKLTDRAWLTRLDLAATAAYVAPTTIHIDLSANAFVLPSPCSSGGGIADVAPIKISRESVLG
jgi:hypothetical protein